MNEIIFEKPERIVEPYSWIGHIPTAFLLVSELKPKTIVELGVHTGNSFFAFCQAIKKLKLKTKCYGVDTWQGEKHAGFYGKEIFDDVKKHSEKYNFIELKKMFFDDAVKDFKDNSIDILHIDGLHTYEAVKHDFKTWLPKVSKNGVILFHDTVVKEKDFGVWKLWEELSKKYKNYKFTHSHGLGILFLGNKTIDFEKDSLGKVIVNVGNALYFKYNNANNEKIIKNRDKDIITLNKEIKNRNNIIKDKNKEIKNKERNIVILNKEIKNIYNSKRWKLITKAAKIIGK